MAATSIVRDRGRAFGLVIALAMSAALVSAPTAFGAVDGDPIATSTFKIKLTKAFKKQLKRNGVKMKPKRLAISGRGNSDVDPTTGRGDLLFKTIRFSLNKKGKRICKRNAAKNRQCKRKVVYKKLRGSMPGVVKGSSGRLFRLSPPGGVTRQGFGALVYGVRAQFTWSAARTINRRLHLNSLKRRNVGRFNLSYQPEAMKVIGGTAQTTSFPTTDPLFGASVGIKLLTGHCVSGIGAGITPIAPATKATNTPGPLQIRFSFPVVGGEISPDGTQGLTETAGGLRLLKSENTGTCEGPPGGTQPYGELTQTGIQTDLTARTVSSVVEILASPCPAGFACGPGPKGQAVGQTTDPSRGVAITSDPVARTISVSGAIVRLAPVSAGTLNAVFPCHSGTDCTSPDPDNTLLGGDPFGTSQLTVQVR